MAAIPSPSSFAASIWFKNCSNSPRFLILPLTRLHRPSIQRVCARLNSSKSSGHVSPDNGGDFQYEMQYGFSPRKASPVFVTLPVDALGPTGQVKRKKAMAQSFRALATAGVEGVVMEVWWGLVEKFKPGFYNWEGYMEIVTLAARYGLKVRAVMAFHQRGSGPEDPCWLVIHHYLISITHSCCATY